MTDPFKTRHMGEFARPSKAFLEAFLIWVEYYVQTDEYDRRLPGVWSQHAHDEWMPHPDQRVRSDAYAKQQREATGAMVDRIEGITSQERDCARCEAQRLGHEQRKAILKEQGR